MRYLNFFFLIWLPDAYVPAFMRMLSIRIRNLHAHWACAAGTDACTEHTSQELVRALSIRGLQCFKLNGNQTENDRYWQKNNFLLFANCLKMYSFFAFAFKVCKMCYYDPKIFFFKNINMGIKKRRILCWFQIRWCRLKKMPSKKARAKQLGEFWVFLFLCIFSCFFSFNFC